MANKAEQIEKLEKGIKNPNIPDAMKNKMQEQLDKLKAEEKPAKKKPAAKKPAAKKPAAKKPAAKKTTKPKDDKAGRKFIEYSGKKYYEDDKDYCEVLVKLYKKRRQTAKRAAATRKTRSVTSRISDKVVSAVTSAVSDIPKKDLQSKTKSTLNKIERVDKAARELVESLIELTGSKVSRRQMESEFKDVKELVIKYKDKYAKI